MDKLKGIAIAGAATLIIVGSVVYKQIDTWNSNNAEPNGPSSGDEISDGVYHDDYIYENTPGSGDELPPDQPKDQATSPSSGDELTFVASCNTIDDSSTCLEYLGDYWATANAAALNCQGAGVYSETACPRPTSGGCQMNTGNSLEMISWFYPYGGDPITGEVVAYMASSCNASGANYIYDN